MLVDCRPTHPVKSRTNHLATSPPYHLATRQSPAVSILLDSVDESLDDLIKPLHDWEFVELQIAETHGKLGTWIQWVLEKIDVLLPESVDCDNKLNYIQKYQMYTTLFYVTDAYVGAQIMAQHKLSEFFGQSRLG